MPKYRITAPDGSRHDVTAPDGTSQEQALEYFKANYRQDEAVPATTTATTRPEPFVIPEDPRGRNPSALNPVWEGVQLTNRSFMEFLTEGITMPKVGDADTLTAARDVMQRTTPLDFIASWFSDAGKKRLEEKLANVPTSETTTGDKILTGALNTGSSVGETMTSPLGIATLGTVAAPAAIQRGVAAAFFADITRHTPDRVVDVYEALKLDLGPQKATEAIGGLMVDAAFLKATGSTALKGGIRPMEQAPLEVAAVKAEAAGAPATAEALKAQAVEPAPKGIAAAAREKLATETTGGEAGAVAVPEWLKTAGEWIRPRDVEAPPEMRLDESNVLPRLNEYATEKANASRPHGVGAVPILGKLLDPRARAYGPVEQAIIGHAASKAKGETIAALWAESNAVTRPKSLIADEAGTIPLTDGTRGYLSDVIEAEMRTPGSQPLLPEQRQWVDEVWKPLNADIKKMMAGENVRGFEMDESGMIDLRSDYFPRNAIGKRDVEGKKGGAGGAGVGSRQFFQKKRLYESEQEGAATTIYEPDPVKRVATLISRAYKAVADTRLAGDELLGGQTVAQRFDAIKAERGSVLEGMNETDRLATLREWRDEAAHPLFMKEGTVDQPAFRDKIFPLETAQKLQKHYADYSKSKLGKLSNVSRSFQLTLDMSAPFNQGLVLMYRNPPAWGTGVAESWKSLFDPERMGKFLQQPEKAEAANQLAQLGVSLRRMQDFVSGKTPENIPGIKQTGRAFGVFMDVAKIEHWIAIRDIYPRSEWHSLAQSLDNTMLSGRMEQIGITPRAAHYERLAALAPSYYRGGIGLVSTALQRGASGKEARKALSAFAVGVTATSVAGMLAVGLTWEEIADRLNNSKGKFMKVPITIGNRNIEVGFGNILLSFSRLLGETVEAANSDSPIRSGAENNPWIRWVRGKLGPFPAFGTDVAVGRDIMGKELGVGKAAVNRFTPITIQQGSGEGTVGGKSVDAALSFLGLQAYPQNVRELFSNERERVAKEKHGKSYEDLSIREQAIISRSLEKEERFKRPEGTSRQREMAYQTDIDRVNRITDGLSNESREKVKTLGLKLTGYDATIPAGGKPLALTRKQTEKYEALVIEEYEHIIGRVDSARFEKLDAKQRQKQFNDMLLEAKNRARGRLKSEAR